MLEVFRQYGWVAVPFVWFAFASYQSWLKVAARRDALETLNAFTRMGRAPPAALVAKLYAR